MARSMYNGDSWSRCVVEGAAGCICLRIDGRCRVHSEIEVVWMSMVGVIRFICFPLKKRVLVRSGSCGGISCVSDVSSV